MVCYVVIFFFTRERRAFRGTVINWDNRLPLFYSWLLSKWRRTEQDCSEQSVTAKEISFAIFNQAICANNLFPFFKARRRGNDHTWGPTRKPENAFLLNQISKQWCVQRPCPALSTPQDCLIASPADRNRLCLEARLAGGACRRTARLEKTEQRKEKLKMSMTETTLLV